MTADDIGKMVRNQNAPEKKARPESAPSCMHVDSAALSADRTAGCRDREYDLCMDEDEI